MTRTSVAAVAAASALVTFASPANADRTEQDYRFVTTLNSIGIRVIDADQATSTAHMVCNEGLRHGVSWREIQGQLIAWGQTPLHADLFILNAVDVYCPQYTASIEDQITADLRRH